MSVSHWLSNFQTFAIGNNINCSAIYAYLLGSFPLGNFTATVSDSVRESLHLGLSWLSPLQLYTYLLGVLNEILEHFLISVLVYCLVCLLIYKLIFFTAKLSATSNNNNNNNHRSNGNGDDGGKNFLRHVGVIKNVKLSQDQTVLKRVLFVVAHPDDECMFFGPSIYSLTKREDCQVYVLCLSNGNFEKQSNLRRQELWESCKLLGIPSSNVILMNAQNLPDDPNVEWKTETVANLILRTVECLDIQAVFTFDREGVSQHQNHCAVYYAVASLCLANLLPKDCKFYTLDSVNVIRKYISIFDLVCTWCISTNWCILSWDEASIIRNAMKKHKSQMKWFRWLYIYFSRYMFINSMREVNSSDVELEMQIHDN